MGKQVNEYSKIYKDNFESWCWQIINKKSIKKIVILHSSFTQKEKIQKVMQSNGILFST